MRGEVYAFIIGGMVALYIFWPSIMGLYVLLAALLVLLPERRQK